MKLIITLEPEQNTEQGEQVMPSIEVDIPEKYRSLILKGTNIATAIAYGIEKIKETLNDRD